MPEIEKPASPGPETNEPETRPADAIVAETPAAETPAAEPTTVVEAVKVVARTETAGTVTSTKVETTKVETPKVETTTVETTKVETPTTTTTIVETAKVETTIVEAGPPVAATVEAEPPKDPRIVGFLCEWAANMNDLLDEEGLLRGMPNVGMIKIPCSGMTKPAWLEMALKQGAEGVFVCGCPIVDCHFREGNIFIRDRMYSRRAPKPKRLDAARTRGYWYEALETDKLVDDLRQFTEDLKQLNRETK
ncbi:MAG TPA: hydrogenase iron-sulfur subunit [Armatimonadota bacterium]|nr:hydrogenase iron-sulfur subunit [Armatimonadota bacterium]